MYNIKQSIWIIWMILILIFNDNHNCSTIQEQMVPQLFPLTTVIQIHRWRHIWTHGNLYSSFKGINVLKFPHELQDQREILDFKSPNDRGETEENKMLKMVFITLITCLADLTTISLLQRSHRWGRCLVPPATYTEIWAYQK